MFEKFGEFDSAEEINKTAAGLKEEGDTESIKLLAKENGIDIEDATDYISGATDELCYPLTAAVGKLAIEKEALALKDGILINDWINYIEELCVEEIPIREAVRKKGKSLSECLGKILEASWELQWNVPKEIKSKTKVNAGRVTFGIPDMGKTKEIIRNYYGGKNE